MHKNAFAFIRLRRTTVCLAVAAWLGSAASAQPSRQPPPPDMKPPSATAPRPDTAAATAESRVLGEYTDARGFHRVYLLVPAGAGDAQLLAAATQAHARYPKGALLFLLDSAEKIRELLAALPDTEKGDTSRYPREWAEAHVVAHTVMNIVPRERRSQWVLLKGPYSGNQLAVLPCPPGDRHCR
ncbi:MAG: hypothetical protein Q4G71_02190 [Pseudomonadota bacterium]|nr:hypothetical protein [Pseudomonadota bacterium]